MADCREQQTSAFIGQTSFIKILICVIRAKKFALNSEGLPAPTRPARIRVIKIKTLAIKAFGKFEGGVDEIEQAFKVGDDFYAITFEHLVGGL